MYPSAPPSDQLHGPNTGYPLGQAPPPACHVGYVPAGCPAGGPHPAVGYPPGAPGYYPPTAGYPPPPYSQVPPPTDPGPKPVFNPFVLEQPYTCCDNCTKPNNAAVCKKMYECVPTEYIVPMFVGLLCKNSDSYLKSDPTVVFSIPQIIDTTVPYVGPLPTLRPGVVIKVCGSITSDCNRFHINLCRGPGDHEEVDHPLHVNPRFDGWITNSVVRSAFLQRKWGVDEKTGKMPVTRGQSFECLILVTDNVYKVAFNGTHFCDFKHRTPKENVTHLNIGGMVKIHSIYVYDPAIAMPQIQYPEPGPPPSCNLPVPYKVEIPGSMRNGRMIVIHGIPEAKPTRFAVDLCYFADARKDIAFHFNPRFNEKTVVCNTMCGSSWGREERTPSSTFPFEPGVPFQIMILCEPDKYKVAVNGKHYVNYKHRLKKLENIRHIQISGQVYLSSVTFQ